jgi:hypothetical protein
MSGWSVAPPAVVVREDGEAYLAGFRNDERVDCVGDALEAIDCEYVVQETEGQVKRHAWRPMSLEGARAALVDCIDPFGRRLAVTLPPGTGLVAAAPSFSQVLRALPPVHLENRDGLERFVAREGRWRPTSSTREQGAYRTRFAGRRYVLRDEEGTCRLTDHSVGKIYAARLERVALHGYDRASRRLFGVLGCDLPGLYSRAVTSFSGQLPTRDTRRFYHEAIPPVLADNLLSKLYQD